LTPFASFKKLLFLFASRSLLFIGQVLLLSTFRKELNVENPKTAMTTFSALLLHGKEKWQID
jgi:hypothetical protein